MKTFGLCCFIPISTMTHELELRRKWTFRAHGRQTVFIKKSFESDIHVFTKAFIWALFLPDYPDLSVEIPVGDRYKPDLVQFDNSGNPKFWGEAGKVTQKKIRALLHRFRSTHFVFAKWNTNLESLRKIVEKETSNICRSAPIDLISFPNEADEHFIRRDGKIQIDFEDIERVRC